MNRFQAAGLHFLASASVILLLFCMVRLVWYPGPLFTAANGINLISLIAVIDVVLGPLIMLIIFNSKKKGMKFDITVVLVLQLGFLAYGAWSIFQARPVYVAFAKSRFHVVTANEVEDISLKKAAPAFKHLPLFGPIIVGTKEPTDKKELEDLLFGGLGGMGIESLPQYYVPYSQAIPDVLKAGRTADTMVRVNPEERQRLRAYQATLKNRNVLFVAQVCKFRQLFTAVDAKTGEIVETF
jgi:hypothetical protein